MVGLRSAKTLEVLENALDELMQRTAIALLSHAVSK